MVDFVHRAKLSTSNPNFSKAEFRIEIRIYSLTDTKNTYVSHAKGVH